MNASDRLGRRYLPLKSLSCEGDWPRPHTVATAIGRQHRPMARFTVKLLSTAEGADGEDIIMDAPKEKEITTGIGATSEGETANSSAEPLGSAGAMADDMLIELVGQDYGMMAMLRNDKFKSLIVFLRNIPPNEWVSEVSKTYPGDDEVKGMLGQVGKLMKMMDYYESKKPRK